MSVRRLFIVMTAAALCGHASASDVRFGKVSALTSPARAGSSVPNLSAGPGGRIYLSWIELQADSTHALRFSTLSGRSWSHPRTIAVGAKGGWFVNWADFPSVLALDDKQLVAHWLARSGAGRYAYDVHVARSSDGGATWTPHQVLHRDRSEAEHGFVSLMPIGGEAGAAWLDGRKHAGAQTDAGGEMTLQFATLGDDAKPAGEVELDGRVCDCCQTAAALTSEGPIVVYRDRSATEVRDIAIVRRVKGRWTAPATVHRDNWIIPACPVNGPAVAARGRDVVVAWFTGADEQSRVMAAFSTDAGRSFGRPVRIDDGQPAGRVDVQIAGKGGAVISWLERVDQTAEVRVKHVTRTGRTSRGKTVATSNAERASGFPHMIYRGNQLIFAWTEPGRPSRVRTASLELAGS